MSEIRRYRFFSVRLDHFEYRTGSVVCGSFFHGMLRGGIGDRPCAGSSGAWNLCLYAVKGAGDLSTQSRMPDTETGVKAACQSIGADRSTAVGHEYGDPDGAESGQSLWGDGAGERERVRKGIRTAFMLSILFCAVVSLFVNVFAEPLLGLFLDREDRAILEIGLRYLHIEGSFYIGIGILFLFYAIFRGLERPGISVILTVISLGLRVVLAYLAAPIWGLDAVWAAVPIGWIVADLAGFGFYFIVQKQLSHIAAE